MSVTRIQHNLSAMNAMSNYQGNQNKLTGNLEKLSSGYRINSAADDAAGLAISEKMRSQIAGLEKAQDNANDGISLVQTAEGALTEVNSMLTRLKTLATQSANGTYEDGIDRANIQEETNALLDEIDRISQSTNFNGINLLDGSMSNSGIKQTDVAVNVNGIAMNAMKSTDAKATSYTMTLGQSGNREGDVQTFKFDYKDESGENKTASISFESGADQVGSTLKLADAINKDAIMGSHFKASVDSNNNLIIESQIKAAAADGTSITKGAASITSVNVVSSGAAVDATTLISAQAGTDYTVNSTYELINSTSLVDITGSSISDVDGLKSAIENNGGAYTATGTSADATIASTATSTASSAVGTVTINSNATLTSVTAGTYTYSSAGGGQWVNSNDSTITISSAEFTAGSAGALADGDTIEISNDDIAKVKGYVAAQGDGTDYNVTVDYSAVAGKTLYDANGNEVTSSSDIQTNATAGTLYTSDPTVSEGSGRTATKTFDLSSLEDGDRVQINGKNYTFRKDEKDVTKATDFHTGNQLASKSQAISYDASATDANQLSKITVTDEFHAGESLTLQVGDTNKDYQKVDVDIKDMSSTGLGLKGLDLSTQESAAAAIDTIQTAVNAVSTQRGKLGALQNRLDHTLNNLDATTQNITAAESQIRDVDMAKEMTQYSKNNILVQAAQSMLAQANSLPQGVLSLLQ